MFSLVVMRMDKLNIPHKINLSAYDPHLLPETLHLDFLDLETL